MAQSNSHINITAFIRVKNEIPTLQACLNSIDGVFDNIVIIYADEPDDGSIDLLHKWCRWRFNCSIYKYPYAVIPSHDKRYHATYSYKNSLAAYNQFGLDKINDNDFVVKIDADQVYIKTRLQALMDEIRTQAAKDDKFKWGIRGYNTFVYNNKLVKYRPNPINGGYDSYIVKKRYLKGFYQSGPIEYLDNHPELKPKVLSGLYWFHFMDTLKSNKSVRFTNEAKEDEIEILTPDEMKLFEQTIRPMFPKDTSYAHIKL